MSSPADEVGMKNQANTDWKTVTCKNAAGETTGTFEMPASFWGSTTPFTPKPAAQTAFPCEKCRSMWQSAAHASHCCSK